MKGVSVDGRWTTARELWMKEDKEQCEAWKDEVQNVLIFSGLFSAIVTAFLIESQADLKPDPVQQSLQVLRQIANQTAGQNWTAQDEPGGIEHISIGINVLWFLSLVLSLSTALVGIVSLQWIRSHTHSFVDGSDSDSLGLSHMQSLGLKQSYIPYIFASLPILLILGLAFFLVGLILFLFNISWHVAIPVTIAIACTFAFLAITTALPALQSGPGDSKESFPSPYRSPQSSLCLFLLRKDWGLLSKKWLGHREKYLVGDMKPFGHLEGIPSDDKPTFAYDTIEALRKMQKNRPAKSEKEKTAIAKCLAEVLPIHLHSFSTEDLADLFPFLQPSKYVPSEVIMRDSSATRKELTAIALFQIATCKDIKPIQNQKFDLINTCLRTTRWLFERPHTFESIPDIQPLKLISDESYEFLPGDLESLIDTLSVFFSFATGFCPQSQDIGLTTHTSHYTYWFLTYSAKILAACWLSKELLDRHTLILRIVTTHLHKPEANDYLFHTALIYASNISTSQAICSSLYWGDFIRVLNGPRGISLRKERSELCKALKAHDIPRGNIDRAFKELESATSAAPSKSPHPRDTRVLPPRQTQDQDPTLDKTRWQSGGRFTTSHHDTIIDMDEPSGMR